MVQTLFLEKMMYEPKFPCGFVALKKYPGYFWNMGDDQLYSMKINGILKPLKGHTISHKDMQAIFRKGVNVYPGISVGDRMYQVSKNGVKKTLSAKYIKYKLLEKNSMIPVQGELF